MSTLCVDTQGKRERFGSNTGLKVCGAFALPRDQEEDNMQSVGFFLDGRGERRDGAPECTR